MRPDIERGRPRRGGPNIAQGDGTTGSVAWAADVATRLRHRRAAGYRLPPMPCGHRDPLDCQRAPEGPATFGLTRTELRLHANTLALYAGWQLWELLQRLDVQPTVCTCCPIHGKADGT